MGKWDLKTLMTGLRYNDRFLASDQSQADGSQDRNITASELAAGFEREVSETGHGLTVGDSVRYNGTAYVEATADTAANAELLGVVTTVIDTDTFAYKPWGQVVTTGLTAGDLYYLQDAGGLGTTAGTVEVPIGVATSTTVLDLTPTAFQATAERVEEASSTTAASGTAETLDLATASVFNVTLTGNCTFTFSNTPPDSYGFTLILQQDATGSRTATWPAAVEWAGGTAPTLTTTASAVDVLTFVTDDGGTTFYGFLAGSDFS